MCTQFDFESLYGHNISMQKVRLKANRDYPIQRKHMWVFSGALAEDYSRLEEGDPVEVVSSEGKALGVGYWCGASIAVKMLRHSNGLIDQQFWREKLSDAYSLREQIGLTSSTETDCFRLVNAEGDGLPGLVIDIYGSAAVLQYHSIGIARQEEQIIEALRTQFDDRISLAYRQCEQGIAFAREAQFSNGYVFGAAQHPFVVKESGYKFLVDWEKGQKSGFFIDQRENRRKVAEFCQGKRVLSAFSYSGAFTVYAAGAKARHVVSVDSSKQAIELLNQNMQLNFPHYAHEAKALDYQSFIKEAANSFDLIILDPPAFAKHRRSVDNAKEGYSKINRSALERLEAGGFLATFSCSQHISREEFLGCVREAGFLARRELQCIAELHQAPCHPINIFHPEVEYLKGFVFRVR